MKSLRGGGGGIFYLCSGRGSKSGALIGHVLVGIEGGEGGVTSPIPHFGFQPGLPCNGVFLSDVVGAVLVGSVGGSPNSGSSVG